MQIKNDVILFKKYAFHDSCMKPIAKELSKLKINHAIESKRHKIYDNSGGDKGKYKIFIIADEWASLFRDCSEILCTTGHSMANKNTTFDIKNHQMDYIYVPSQYYKTEFLNRCIVPKKEIIITGYPAASKIFRDKKSPLYEKVDSYAPRILIAPTYNKDLSIMDALIKEEKENKLFEKLGNYIVMFKLHPVLYKKYPYQASFCKELDNKYKHVIYHEDSHDDIANMILWADLMIGDSSGALLLGAAGDIPIVAFDNPNRNNSEYYDPTGPEWLLRNKFAKIINEETIYDLPGILEFLLEEDFQKDSRQEVVNLLFEHQLDAELQIANHIASLL